MNAVTLTFLVIGGIGVVLLAAALLFDDIASLGHPDADGPFSLPSIAGFVGAFGFGAAAAASIVGNGLVAVIVGLVAGMVAGVPAAIGTLALAHAAQRMHTDATPTRGDMLGRRGVVVTPIPAQGYGEVRISIGGQPVKLNARAEAPIPLGAHVFVIEAPSDTSVIVEQTPPV